MKLRQKFNYLFTFSFVRFTTACLLAACSLFSEVSVAQSQDTQSLLWKISGGPLQQPSYLYGTIHAICVDDLRISPEMRTAMQNSQQLALEVDISNPAELQQLQAGMQMPASQKLSNYLSAQEYDRVARFYQDSLNLSLNQLQGLKPFFISSLLYTKLLDCPVLSYENQLSSIMGQQQKPIVGLESARDQLRVLDAIPYQDQARLLLEAVQDYPELKDGYWNMVVSYKNGDLQSLYEIVQEVSIGMKSYEKLLLQDRNRRWMPTIETLARSKPTFIAVGAAHLSGEEGLIKLLRRRGYTVEPIQEFARVIR